MAAAWLTLMSQLADEQVLLLDLLLQRLASLRSLLVV